MHEEPVAIESKVAALRQPAAYAGQPGPVEVIETHMSWVFLAGPMAYKLKKPVRYGRLDFRTLEARRFFCMEELRLNRQLAESVYLDVIPLRLDAGGALRIDAAGTVVDWLVMMRRLAPEFMLDRMLEELRVSAGDVRALATRLVAFYRSLPPVPIDRWQYLNRLAGEIDECERELCDPAFDLEADPVHSLCDRLRSLLKQRGDLFAARVAAGKVIEGHGDLRPEHIYLGTPPAIIDRLEFSADLRILDVVDELGFLALECERLGSPELGRLLLETYRQLTGDTAGEPLIHFYQCLRACTRAKITIWHLREARYHDSAKWPARARQYLGLAARHMQSCESALLRKPQGPMDEPTLPAAA
jgi:aminoglycoside phosphotransferase family enzyme